MARIQLPTELVHIAISMVVAEYIDDVIMGPFSRGMVLPDTPGKTDLENDAAEDAFLVKINPVESLMTVSYQYRQVTLNILSETLGIPFVQGSDMIWRLAHKPWPRISLFRSVSSRRCGDNGQELAGDQQTWAMRVSGESAYLAKYGTLLAVRNTTEHMMCMYASGRISPEAIENGSAQLGELRELVRVFAMLMASTTNTVMRERIGTRAVDVFLRIKAVEAYMIPMATIRIIMAQLDWMSSTLLAAGTTSCTPSIFVAFETAFGPIEGMLCHMTHVDREVEAQVNTSPMTKSIEKLLGLRALEPLYDTMRGLAAYKFPFPDVNLDLKKTNALASGLAEVFSARIARLESTTDA